MLCSEGRRIENLLNNILSIARSSEENEKKAYSALEYHLRFLQDRLFETTIEHPENSANSKNIHENKSKKLDYNKKEVDDFDTVLTKHFGYKFSLPTLVSIGEEIGAKYGVYLTREMKRSRPKTLLWVKENYNIFRDDFAETAARIKAEKSKK